MNGAIDPIMSKVLRQIGNKWSGGLSSPFISRNGDIWMNEETQFFAIGSCFARNFVRWLAHQGLPLSVPPWGLHYNAATIWNEIRSASGRSSKSITWEFQDRSDNLCFLDALRHTITAHTADELERVRNDIVEQSRDLYARSDAFLITLGLSEIWEQTYLNPDGSRERVIINRAPYKGAKTEGAFHNRFMRVDEVVQYLRDITDLIRSDKGDSTPIVFTVSPIPLKTTSSGFTPQVANIRSKTTLLSAVHEFIDEDTAKRPASYFPAYEIFCGDSTRAHLWQEDLRHPKAEAIDFVCRQFLSNYAGSEALAKSNQTFSVPGVTA